MKPTPPHDGSHPIWRLQVDDLLAGKPDAYIDWFDRWYPRVHAWALRRARDPDAARDLTERSMFQIVQALPGYDGSIPLDRFVLAVAEATRRRGGVTH